jgi:lipid A ethanolaminephosphotransferase
VPGAQASQPPDGIKLPAGLCHSGECLDEALLIGLNARIAALPAERRAKGVVLVLHQMGSHGPAYWARSPQDRKRFKPECTNSALQTCDRDAIVNAYDNSIAYTDHVLAEAIRWLNTKRDRFDPALLYVSDHGESLGENHIYLHGLPYAIAPAAQKRVPMIVWLSPQAEMRTGASMACLRGEHNEVLSHDYLFHTVLGLTGVQAGEYRDERNLLSTCQASKYAGRAANAGGRAAGRL